MNYPSHLKIGAHHVRLVFAASWPECDTDVLAQYFPERNEMFIKEGLPKTQTFSALWHEAMHFMNGTINHELLDSLAEQQVQFLFDNEMLDDNFL